MFENFHQCRYSPESLIHQTGDSLNRMLGQAQPPEVGYSASAGVAETHHLRSLAILGILDLTRGFTDLASKCRQLF
jgi:hypothetical protein